MSRQGDVARSATGELSRLAVGHALVGGLAVSIRSEPRFTQDLDIAVAVENDTAAERVVHSFVQRGYVTTALVEHETKDRLATVRLEHPVDRQVVDLLFASSGIEPEIAAASEVLEVLPGLRLPVARVGHLIALKLLARDDETRPQDAGDLAALVAVADPEELARAAEAVDLIEHRGYNRSRDLHKALADVLEP